MMYLDICLVENKRDIINLLIKESEVLQMMNAKRAEFYKDYFEDFEEYKKIWEDYELEHWDELVKEQKIFERNREIILNMLKQELPLDKISLYLGMPIREVKRIINI